MMSFELSFNRSTLFSAKLGCELEKGDKEVALLKR